MNDTGVIDRFFEVFSRYIDSGFGLLGGEVAFVATTLIVIDVTLAALFWAWGPSDDILARLVKKTLFVGFFAFLIGNFQRLSEIVFASFAGLGLKASGSNLSSEDFLRPGKLAQAGIDAGRPMLKAAAEMSGFPGFFENFVQIAILMVAFLIVLIAFFIMAVQLFVTLIEFKLTSLAGFVLIPFGLFGKTAFLAERVLGNVVASGVKVLVLAVIVGIWLDHVRYLRQRLRRSASRPGGCSGDHPGRAQSGRTGHLRSRHRIGVDLRRAPAQRGRSDRNRPRRGRGRHGRRGRRSNGCQRGRRARGASGRCHGGCPLGLRSLRRRRRGERITRRTRSGRRLRQRQR